jgi:hypothetical protein
LQRALHLVRAMLLQLPHFSLGPLHCYSALGLIAELVVPEAVLVTVVVAEAGADPVEAELWSVGASVPIIWELKQLTSPQNPSLLKDHCVLIEGWSYCVASSQICSAVPCSYRGIQYHWPSEYISKSRQDQSCQ